MPVPPSPPPHGLSPAGGGGSKRASRRIFFAIALIACAPALAQPYPAKPIRLILPAAPGGASDIAGRLIAQRLSQGLGQPVVAENRGGGGGNVATESVARAAPDGYTLLLGPVSMAIAPALYKSLPWDPVRDFTPITMGTALANVLVAHPSVPASSMVELLALARAKPRTLNFGSSGNASAGHLAGELLGSMAGVELVHVPYKGGGPAMTDLLAGQIQLIFASAPTAIPHVRSGKLKAIAVTTSARLASLPEVPTVAESGIAGYEANNWYAFFGPAGLSRDIVMKLNREIGRAMTHPETRDALALQGLVPEPGTPEALAAYLASEIAKWGKLVRERGITAE